MSRLADAGFPCACEADILGTLSMHACQLASGTPAALADWNNLHNEDDELVNLWHCGVFPKAFAKDQPRLKVHEILKSVSGIGPEKSVGTIEFEVKPSPVTLLRVTQDSGGTSKTLIVEGRFEANPAKTFGSYGWCRITGLQTLYREVLLVHFPHHVAATQGHFSNPLREAFKNYLNLDVYPAASRSKQ
jgi:L-fucose isomerase-like protein